MSLKLKCHEPAAGTAFLQSYVLKTKLACRRRKSSRDASGVNLARRRRNFFRNFISEGKNLCNSMNLMSILGIQDLFSYPPRFWKIFSYPPKITKIFSYPPKFWKLFWYPPKFTQKIFVPPQKSSHIPVPIKNGRPLKLAYSNLRSRADV